MLPFHNIVVTISQQSFLTNTEIKREVYENLLENLPTLLFYMEKFKKNCIDMDEGTQN